jgi:hypothetical protein
MWKRANATVVDLFHRAKSDLSLLELESVPNGSLDRISGSTHSSLKKSIVKFSELIKCSLLSCLADNRVAYGDHQQKLIESSTAMRF